eukprot:CAMPEP_0180659016 /NCGR_PEP_ID=MMETSP1037_2-20121125/57338_1 /TAXON_ID=632150 /ORGANISM="Azadinium spinosum, Strain 3D9" /LENGTH=50 /DNA_ID=CAMNT_0022685993 /DNA_START=39 /DNA_END=188 /DNA_ORIENTATION=+
MLNSGSSTQPRAPVPKVTALAGPEGAPQALLPVPISEAPLPGQGDQAPAP